MIGLEVCVVRGKIIKIVTGDFAVTDDWACPNTFKSWKLIID